MTVAAREPDILPAEWREHYADLAAAWVREKGTLPPSFDALAEWAATPTEVPPTTEIAYLEGQAPDPYLLAIPIGSR